MITISYTGNHVRFRENVPYWRGSKNSGQTQTVNKTPKAPRIMRIESIRRNTWYFYDTKIAGLRQVEAGMRLTYLKIQIY